MTKILLLNGSRLNEKEARERVGVTDAVYQVLDWEAPVSQQEKTYSHALIVLDFEDYTIGPKAPQKQFLLNSTGAQHWIIVLLGVSGAFGPVTDKWRKLSSGIKAGITVLYEHPRRPDLREQVRAYVQKDPSKCLIGYYSRKEIAEKAASLFSETVDGWEFEAVPSGSLAEGMRGAGKLILLGREEQEFQIPPVPVDTRRDLLLFLDCSGPLFREFYGYRVEGAVLTLCGCGWEFPILPPRYIVGNLQYEMWKLYRSQLKQDEHDFHVLTIWDEFGIPYLHKDYTPKEIDSFLSGFDSVKEVREWLEATK